MARLDPEAVMHAWDEVAATYARRRDPDGSDAASARAASAGVRVAVSGYVTFESPDERQPASPSAVPVASSVRRVSSMSASKTAPGK